MTGVSDPALGLGRGLIATGLSEPALGLLDMLLNALLISPFILVGVRDFRPSSGVLKPMAVFGLKFGAVVALSEGVYRLLGV